MNRMLLLISLLFFWGCVEDILPPGYGPCIHENLEPILTLEEVTSEVDGQGISELILSDFYVDSLSWDLDYFRLSISENIMVLDSSITCTVPCAFGSEGSKYKFNVSAQGYRDSTISTDVGYNVFEGGCPSYADDGTKIRFTLKPN